MFYWQYGTNKITNGISLIPSCFYCWYNTVAWGLYMCVLTIRLISDIMRTILYAQNYTQGELWVLQKIKLELTYT